ncbi:hypothetical protein [Mesorhizobium sp. ORM16]|uniref:hypothetical protein n=1 Tax=Mesorhizobium sp. ORM16 TaxID=3376989 RepID=UPI0038576660
MIFIVRSLELVAMRAAATPLFFRDTSFGRYGRRRNRVCSACKAAVTAPRAQPLRLPIFLALPANKWDDTFGPVEDKPARDGRTGRPPLRTD